MNFQDKRRLKCEAAKPIVPPSTDANEGPQEEEAAKSEPVVNGKSEPETVKKETNDDEDVPGDSQNAQKAKNEDQSDDEATESEGEVEDKDASAPNADQPQDAVKLENGTEEGSQVYLVHSILLSFCQREAVAKIPLQRGGL